MNDEIYKLIFGIYPLLKAHEDSMKNGASSYKEFIKTQCHTSGIAWLQALTEKFSQTSPLFCPALLSAELSRYEDFPMPKHEALKTLLLAAKTFNNKHPQYSYSSKKIAANFQDTLKRLLDLQAHQANIKKHFTAKNQYNINLEPIISKLKTDFNIDIWALTTSCLEKELILIDESSTKESEELSRELYLLDYAIKCSLRNEVCNTLERYYIKLLYKEEPFLKKTRLSPASEKILNDLFTSNQQKTQNLIANSCFIDRLYVKLMTNKNVKLEKTAIIFIKTLLTQDRGFLLQHILPNHPIESLHKHIHFTQEPKIPRKKLIIDQLKKINTQLLGQIIYNIFNEKDLWGTRLKEVESRLKISSSRAINLAKIAIIKSETSGSPLRASTSTAYLKSPLGKYSYSLKEVKPSTSFNLDKNTLQCN